jgi:diphthine synthase
LRGKNLLKELVFVGLGLNDERGISLRGIEEAKTAEEVFMELYTNLMPDFSVKNFEHLVGKNLHLLSRRDLEEENGMLVLNAAEKGKTVFLVPGDPFIATTHVALRLEAKKRGVKTRIIHGSSVISAIIGLSGLQNYKFGKTVTIPFPENVSETPYKIIGQNKSLGLHSLCLLDIKADEGRFLRINDALHQLLEFERRNNLGFVLEDSFVVGVARAGSEEPVIRADSVRKILEFDFGGPPQSMIFPGELHFAEVEALIAFAEAPASLRSPAR